MEKLYSTELACVLGHGDLLCIAWLGPNDAQQYSAVCAYEDQMRAKVGARRFARLTIVTKDAIRKPDPALQAAIDARGHIAAGGWLKASAMAMVAEGFVASFMRGLVASTSLVNRPDHPTKIASSVSAACEWLAPHVVAPGGRRVGGVELSRLIGAHLPDLDHPA